MKYTKLTFITKPKYEAICDIDMLYIHPNVIKGSMIMIRDEFPISFDLPFVNVTLYKYNENNCGIFNRADILNIVEVEKNATTIKLGNVYYDKLTDTKYGMIFIKRGIEMKEIEFEGGVSKMGHIIGKVSSDGIGGDMLVYDTGEIDYDINLYDFNKISKESPYEIFEEVIGFSIKEKYIASKEDLSSIIIDLDKGEVEFYVNRECEYSCDMYLPCPRYDVSDFKYTCVAYLDGQNEYAEDLYQVFAIQPTYIILYNVASNLLSIEYDISNLDIEFEYTDANLDYIDEL